MITFAMISSRWPAGNVHRQRSSGQGRSPQHSFRYRAASYLALSPLILPVTVSDLWRSELGEALGSSSLAASATL
jgi:hypothetical protein